MPTVRNVISRILTLETTGIAIPMGVALRAVPPLHAYVGRQAIFDRDLRVVAYELLYRDSEENRARFSDATQASAATILNAFVELGLDQLARDLPVYVNLPSSFLLGEMPIPLPPERTVIEVLEDVPVTPALLDSLRDLRARGFRIALDDFVLTDETRALLPLADVIKVSVLHVPADEVRAQYAALRPVARTLLAEKVSTHDEMEMLQGLGFELFQGHFLELPVVSKSQRLPHDKAALLKLLEQLYRPNLDLRQVEKLVAGDVGFAVRLLKLANSAAMSRGTPIGTITEAISRVGTQQVAALAVLVIAANFDDKPLELARQTLIRARMCELLARGSAAPPDQLFTAGLLSLLDALLDVNLDEILRQLPVTPVIRDALTASKSEPARIVAAVRAQSSADFARVDEAGFSPQRVFVAWFEAIAWADQLMAIR
jgi:c-di-GMP phosphodiesterase